MEDIEDATEVKIHRDTCGFYQRHVQNPTSTTRWHVVDDLDAARTRAEEISRNYTKGWKLAECCFENR